MVRFLLIPPSGLSLIPLRVLYRERTPSIYLFIFLILFTIAKKKSKIESKKVLKKGYAKQVNESKSFSNTKLLSYSKRRERLLQEEALAYHFYQLHFPLRGQQWHRPFECNKKEDKRIKEKKKRR